VSGVRPDYRTVKLCLDLAASLLLFLGQYAPTYVARSARLDLLAENLPGGDGLPFPLQPFASMVQRLTQWKAVCPSATLEMDTQFRQKVWDYARRLWRWELLRLTGGATLISNSRLMRDWMQSQPLNRRLRGWASLARKHGCLRGWRAWPHWLRLGTKGSPRYWIYGAACELFFQLPALMGDCEDVCPDRFLRTWSDWLPVSPPQPASGNLLWQQLASAVTWNYRQFLTETSS
jgi:hypothetical protein